MLAAVLAPSWAPATPAPKPVTVWVDRECDRALVVAEATIATVELATGGAWATKGGGLRAKITADPNRVWVGLEHAGAELDLQPPPFGRLGATTELEGYAKSGRPVLLVVNRKAQVVLLGVVREQPEPTYRLHSWCDFNTALLLAHDKRFTGRLVRGGIEGSRKDYTRALFEARYAARRDALAKRMIAVLTGAPRLENSRLRALVARLGHDEYGERMAARATLVARGGLRIAGLRAARDAASDFEIRANLESVLAELEPWEVALGAAAALRARGPALEARFLAGHAGPLAPNLKQLLRARLRVLARRMREDPAIR